MKKIGRNIGYRFAKIIKLHIKPKLTAEPGWNWHSPKSVSFKMMYEADIITSNIAVETRSEIVDVRLYRETAKGEWKSFLVSPITGELKSKNEYHVEQIKRLEKTTLAYTLNELQAQKQAANLPAVDVPEFATPEELAQYIHQILISGSPDQLKAVLLQTLDPRLYLIPGSTVQLNPSGNNLVDKAIKTAYLNPLKYRDQYCARLKKGSLSSAQHIYIQGGVPKTTSLISITKAALGYVNGVAVSKWKISKLDIVVRQDEEVEQYLKSLTNPSSLCSNN